MRPKTFFHENLDPEYVLARPPVVPSGHSDARIQWSHTRQPDNLGVEVKPKLSARKLTETSVSQDRSSYGNPVTRTGPVPLGSINPGQTKICRVETQEIERSKTRCGCTL